MNIAEGFLYNRHQTLRRLARRLLDITYCYKLSHIGSCLTALPILYGVYLDKKPEDRVVLSAGHSGLALYVVLEHFGLIRDAESRLAADGIHPTRGPGVDVSTGSLGQGITVAVGMALARPDAKVYVVSTDGEMAEGAWWEAIYFKARYPLGNLHIIVNHNGYSALGSTVWTGGALQPFGVATIDTSKYVPTLPWFAGLQQHYQVMTEEQYKELSAHYAD
jgi:transketolase N-terminal domain/subunit